MATADKLALLKATKADLKAALTEQGQTPGDVFETYPDLVRAIQTGVTLPTLTSPGAAADLRQGKQLIDQSGAVVNGAIPDKAGQSYVPTTTSQKIAAGQYLAGDQIIAGDANLLPESIVSGKSIFGVAGTAAASQKYEVVSNIDGMGKTSITIPCSFKPKGFILLPQGNVNKTYAASFSFIRTLQGHLPEYDISVSQEYNVSSATYFAARMYDAAYEELYFTIQYLANSIVITSKTYNGILFGFATMYQAIVFG